MPKKVLDGCRAEQSEVGCVTIEKSDWGSRANGRWREWWSSDGGIVVERVVQSV